MLVVMLAAGAGAGVSSLLTGGDSIASSVAHDLISAASLLDYQQAASTCPGLPWTVLAAIATVESDNGTERLARLAGKLDGYARLAAEAGHPNWVLFTFPGHRREADARRVLTHPAVPVATAARVPGFAPDTAIWRPADRSGPRLRLAQLADLPLDSTAGGR